ncbi:MAG TPA: GDP-mannose 4,6-dehydratase, partial [Nitrosopumilaceae archaeon]|nr:GDP-mannose 4,6-dehydratase [Nitrosopumilaceae archaeon]
IAFPYKADENYPVYMPKSPYAVSKFSSEAYCRSYYLTYDYPIVITRGFNTFGPRQKAGSKGAVIPSFLTRVLKDKPPVINGDGGQTRDFTYASDIAEGIYRCLTLDRVAGETINLCSGIGRTMLDVAQQVIDICGKSDKLKPEHVIPKDWEMLRSVGDNSKAKKLLNWEPKIDFEDGIRETADFLRERVILDELPLYMKN